MAPVVIIAIPCENKPCNMTNTIVRVLNNTTSTDSPDGSNEDYDHQGAARFIIATVLVYSLMGVFGMLLLRFKRSASRSRRSASTREETVLKYIKKTDRLMLEARRDVMKKEAERTADRLNILRQKSQESDVSTNPRELSLSNSFNLSASLNSSQFRMPYSPTSTSLSLLMPLLPAVQEATAENARNPQTDTPSVVFHFPALTPLTVPQTMIAAPRNFNSLSPSDTSTPTTLVTGLSYSPSSTTIRPNDSANKSREDAPISRQSNINNNSEDTSLNLASDNNNERHSLESAV